MGYFVKIKKSSYFIPAENVDEAYDRFVKLNDFDEAKRGGQWGGELSNRDPRPEGMNYHPSRWYSWMPADYPSECVDAEHVLEHLGFDVILGEDNKTIFIVDYDNKSGQEDIFLDAIYDLAKGQIDWVGEDDLEWTTEAGVYENKLAEAIEIQNRILA